VIARSAIGPRKLTRRHLVFRERSALCHFTLLDGHPSLVLPSAREVRVRGAQPAISLSATGARPSLARRDRCPPRALALPARMGRIDRLEIEDFKS
jgi:hypothetical protein